MSQASSLQDQIIARAMQDDAFRQRLLSHPIEALSKMGITLPEGVTVRVFEDTPTTLHLVLPRQPQAGTMQDLSDEELGQASGGAMQRALLNYKTGANVAWA